jgi:uncharacterized membrane protein YuzA (DUF378 family)
MKALNLLTLLLVIVGGVNWGLVAMDFNLVAALFGTDTTVTTIIYALVGLSALWQIIPLIKAMRTGEVHAEAATTKRTTV